MNDLQRQQSSERHDRIDEKLDLIYESVEKTRKMILTTAIVSIVLFVLPIIGLVILIPIVLGSIGSAYEGLL